MSNVVGDLSMREKLLTMITFTEDRPIERIENDLFGREPIVDMISNAIIQKANKEHGCYVIGIYGKWGEGKTSVMNLVESKLLSNNDDNILISKFNPWLFKDQESLLLEFFNVLASESVGTIIADKIKKYAPIIALGVQGMLNIAQLTTGIPMPFGSRLGKKIREIGNAMSDSESTVPQRKKDISNELRKSGKHLVIFIDDIDRLDKEETHAVLKLIKQNADFDNVIYLLAMDVEMVAKSIGNRFGEGVATDGYNFIEKIVQVPVTLPKIQASHLKLLLDRQLREVISALPPAHDSVTNHIDKSTEDIVNSLSGLFETKRDILRYTNQIQFMLSTLYAEVNISDLCMLEAIKLFHSAGYEAIQRKQDVILHKDQDWTLAHAIHGKDQAELNKIKEENRNNLLDSIMKGCPEKYDAQIRRIIKDQLLHRYFHDHSTPFSKRLNDPNYFNKYFIGCTPDNMISDRMSYELAEQMSDMEHSKNAITLDSILDKFGWEEVRRIISFMIDLEKEASEKNAIAKKMAISISLMQFTGQGVQWWSVETFLCNIMNHMFLPATNSRNDIKRDEEIIFNTGKTIIESASLDFIPRFASVLYEDLNIAHKNKINLVKLAIDRIIQGRGADELLKVGQWAKVRLLAALAETDMAELDLLIEKKASESEFNVIDFLEGFVEESTQRGNNYSWIDKIFPHNTPIYNAIYAKVPEDQIKNNAAIQAFLKSYNTTRISIRDIARQRRK